MKLLASGSRRWRALAGVTAVLMLLGACAAGAADRALVAVATYTKGKVQIQKPESQDWRDLVVGQFIYEGDTLRTGPLSRAGITFAGGIENRINANTTIKIQPLDLSRRGDGSSVQIILGKVWSRILRKGAKFRVHTPISVCTVRGTEFETTVMPEGGTWVKVYEGVVEFSNEYGSRMLNKNTKSSCAPGAAPAVPEVMGGDDRDTWQNAVSAGGSLRIDAGAAIAAGSVIIGAVTVYDDAGRVDGRYGGTIRVSSEYDTLLFAPIGGGTWAAALEGVPRDGVLPFRVTPARSPQGPVHITAAASGRDAGLAVLQPAPSSAKILRVKIAMEDGTEKELTLTFTPGPGGSAE